MPTSNGNGTGPSAPGRTADLHLRHRAGTVACRVRWPAPAGPEPAPAVVLLPDVGPGDVVVDDEALAEAFRDHAGCVVLSVPWRRSAADVRDRFALAARALEWVVDHAAELRADPGHVVVAGRGAGAVAAAMLALRAAAADWPRVAQQVLIVPSSASRAGADCSDDGSAAQLGRRAAVGGAVAPAILAAEDGGDVSRCAGRLWDLNIPVAEIRGETPILSAIGELRARLAAARGATPSRERGRA